MQLHLQSRQLSIRARHTQQRQLVLGPLFGPHCNRHACIQARSSINVSNNGTEQAEQRPTSLDNEASNSNSTQGEPPAGGDQHPLLRLLKQVSAPAQWLTAFVAALHKKEQQAWRMFRLLAIAGVFLVAAGTRQLMDGSRTQVRTREVLYSDFVRLLDGGRVRAARLEAGTGKLYFDVLPQQPAAATTNPATTTTAPSSTATPATPAATDAAAGTNAAVAAATTAAVAASSSVAEVTAGAGVGASAAGMQAQSQAVVPVRFQRQYMVKLADKIDYLLASKILASGVEFAVLKKSFTSVIANVVVTALAVWVPLLPLFFLFRRILEDRNQTRKKKSDNKGQNVPVTFRDVAGVDAAKEELMETVTVMKAVKSSYTRLKVKIPSGVLLCGPPGTGKTLLAKAVAGEAGVPFFAFSASEFVELYVGRGAARVREVFAEARKAAPCVVFIDELDAVGARRGMGYNDERDQTLNQLLTELDGFEGRQGILFLAATNRVEILDSALLRPGRISRKVNVPLPDEKGRKEILGVHLRTTPMDSLEDKAEACERLAKVTAGFSGAELANVVSEATLLAARGDQEVVTLRELLEGVRRTRFGVNGAASSGPANGLQKWLMDLATGPADGRKVKTAAAS